MTYPKIIFINPRKKNVYLKNLLNWLGDNQKIKKNFQGIAADDLIMKMGTMTDNLKKFWLKVEKGIMVSIPEISGFAWDLKKVPAIFVYPIPFFHSFSHPLFLKICDVVDGRIKMRKIGLLLGMLIHEVIHYNIHDLPVSREINEDLINFMTNKILQIISNSYVSDYQNFYSKIGRSLNFSALPEKIIAGKSTIKKFYKKELGRTRSSSL